MPAVKELQVKESSQSDVGKGIARLSPDALALLGAVEGDVVEITGSDGRKTLALAMAEQGGEGEPTSIRLDGVLRNNSGASVGEIAKVRKIETEKAREVLLAPRQAITYRKDFVTFVHEKVLGRPLLTGNNIILDVVGRTIIFTVVKTKPTGAVLVNQETKLSIAKKPLKAIEESSVRYEDIGGLKTEIENLREMVEVPMRHPEVFKKLGVSPPKGLLLHGPPGCGKTLLARAVANESEAYFITMNGPELMSKFYGQSEENLRKIFEEARDNAPAVIFMDEIDAIAPKRDDVGGEVERRVVSQLLTLMDGLEARGDIIVIAATNRPNAVDPALRRPGRFDREVSLGIPSKEGRFEVFQIHTRGMPLAPDVDLSELVGLTNGFTGADVSALCKEAAMRALRGILPEMKKGIGEQLSKELLDRLTITRADFLEALKNIEPSAMREVRVDIPRTKWEDVGGLNSVKQELIEAVEWPLNRAAAFKRLGITPPRGILLIGPPGCGKTLLARAVATETKANFIHVNGPELLSKWVGESEKAVRELFKKAKQVSPAILFFDEIDSIAGERGSRQNGNQKLVDQLLAEMDGMESVYPIVVLAATNRPELLEKSLLRSGRFDKTILVPLPAKEERKKIFEIHSKHMPLSPDVRLEDLANATEGYSGADIAAVCREAGLFAMREDMNAEKITAAHFMEAAKKIKSSVDDETRKKWRTEFRASYSQSLGTGTPASAITKNK